LNDRLGPRGTQAIDTDDRLALRVDRTEVVAYEGDTIGSAMAAAGLTITGRSFKYHRPRGLMCMTGHCPNCLVTVDGIPNVRACITPVRHGMEVRRQNAWGTVDHDLLGIVDRFSFMLPPGFYYKIGHRPRWAWPLVEPIIRRIAGLGKLPRTTEHRRRNRINLHPDVLVVGGGPAGLAAAAEAARAGAGTVLVEGSEGPGGHLRPVERAQAPGEDVHGMHGADAVRVLANDARDAGAELLLATPAFGVFEGPLIAAAGRDALYRIRARHVIFTNGAIEQPSVFVNNDLPGVMLSGAVNRLLSLYRVLPGRQAIVATTSDRGYVTATALRAAGAAVLVADLRDDPAGAAVDDARRAGARVATGVTILAAHGRRAVRSVVVGRPDGRDARRIACDLVVIAGVLAPSTNLLAQAGAELAFDERTQAFLPEVLPPWMHAAGEVAGAPSLEAILAQGRLAGLEAAAAVGALLAPTGRFDELRSRAALAGDPVVLPPDAIQGSGKQFACMCMDVTSKELKTAVAEGFDSMELLKRYTTITMGPCQGKACQLPSQRLCGRSTGRSYEETPPTTARPPWTPVPLGVLASDARTPRRETQLHDRHVEAGASFLWTGDWRRPHHYASAEEEARAVHEAVGVIDVSTLGKFLVKGPQAVGFLERLYPNRFEDLPVGKIRYGVMLNDDGVIIDDGAVCRLASEEFFITATTGNAGSVDRWISWWLADWELDVRVVNVSAAYAALNLAGPHARKVMQRLTEMDVSAEALPYLACARGDVAGAPAIVLRIGFVGELGYEIHVPGSYAEHLWDAALAAGDRYGIQPFGLEAQRVLRLEKQHILVGQDTDAESDPYEAGLGWMVKLDKPDFLGRRALLEASAHDPRERLVGLVFEGDGVPPEGSAIVEDGRWVGRVTSCRRSPAHGGVIGMGWVPTDLAAEGRPVGVQADGRRFTASVTIGPIYDPEGARLRS
jgi:sarcosine oxidase, subunit alpha